MGQSRLQQAPLPGRGSPPRHCPSWRLVPLDPWAPCPCPSENFYCLRQLQNLAEAWGSTARPCVCDLRPQGQGGSIWAEVGEACMLSSEGVEVRPVMGHGGAALTVPHGAHSCPLLWDSGRAWRQVWHLEVKWGLRAPGCSLPSLQERPSPDSGRGGEAPVCPGYGLAAWVSGAAEWHWPLGTG